MSGQGAVPGRQTGMTNERQLVSPLPRGRTANLPDTCGGNMPPPDLPVMAMGDHRPEHGSKTSSPRQVSAEWLAGISGRIACALGVRGVVAGNGPRCNHPQM